MDLHKLVSDALDRYQRRRETAPEAGQVYAERIRTVQGIAALLDHTLLKPETTRQQIEQLCADARDNVFASVCINPVWVPLCCELLQDTSVKVDTVIGFPLGANATATKLYEAEHAIHAGADEIDMVIQIGQLKDRNYDVVWDEIQRIVELAHREQVLVKTIVETGLLVEKEKVAAAALAAAAKVDYVKTSTGFVAVGATVEDVALMRSVVGPTVGVKASGGIRSYDAVQSMVAAGATRIGTSAGTAIMQQARAAMAKVTMEAGEERMGEF